MWKIYLFFTLDPSHIPSQVSLPIISPKKKTKLKKDFFFLYSHTCHPLIGYLTHSTSTPTHVITHSPSFLSQHTNLTLTRKQKKNSLASLAQVLSAITQNPSRSLSQNSSRSLPQPSQRHLILFIHHSNSLHCSKSPPSSTVFALKTLKTHSPSWNPIPYLPLTLSSTSPPSHKPSHMPCIFIALPSFTQAPRNLADEPPQPIVARNPSETLRRNLHPPTFHLLQKTHSPHRSTSLYSSFITAPHRHRPPINRRHYAYGFWPWSIFRRNFQSSLFLLVRFSKRVCRAGSQVLCVWLVNRVHAGFSFIKERYGVVNWIHIVGPVR